MNNFIYFFYLLSALFYNTGNHPNEPPSEKNYSIIYFYRISSLAEPKRSFDLYLNDRLAFTLNRESRMEFKIFSEGTLKILAEFRGCSTSPIFIDVKNGDDHYVKIDGVSCICLDRIFNDGERDYLNNNNFEGVPATMQEDVNNPYMKLPVKKDETVVAGDQNTGKAPEGNTEYKNKTALVIGNSEYVEGRLKNPVNDANAIAKELKLVGFEVILYTDVTLPVFRDAVHTFGDKLNANKGVGLFYYAGHGLQAGGVNYLVPVDAKIEREYDIPDECIRADLVLRMMEMYQNPLNIIILDACRNNPYTRSFRSLDRGLAQPEVAPTGSIIAFATAPGKTASDGDGENGLYTQEFIKTMQVPGLSIEEVFKRVRISVAEKSKDEQVPWENSSLTGNFYFIKE